MRHTSRYLHWKNWGSKDFEKKEWNIHLLPYEYDDDTKDCILGYIEGVGTHDSKWMIAKYKELILKNTDCIRFIRVNSIEDLSELIEFIIQNNIDLSGKISTLPLIEDAVLKHKDQINTLSESFYLYFFSLLPEILTNPLHKQNNHHIAEITLNIILTKIPESETIENLAFSTHQMLRKIRRESNYLEERNVINKFCKILESKFPKICKKIEKVIENIKNAFFQINLELFLFQQKTEIQDFKINFPNLYKIFLLPLDQEKYFNLPLYLFFFEKVFYRPIFLYLNMNKKRTTYVNKKYLEMLENAFNEGISFLEEIDKEHLIRKFSGLLNSFEKNNISTIADISWGLYGEIRGLQELTKQIGRNTNQVEIPDELNKGNEGKVCDIRIWNLYTKSYQLFECKCKIPGYGYDGEESFLNDFLLNYIPLFSCFISFCMPEINILTYFPNFSFLNELSYGNLSDYLKLMRNKNFRTDYSYKELRDPAIEKMIMENIISCFFEEDFQISLGYQLPTEQKMVEIKEDQAKLLLEKDFLKNTLKKALKQFFDENKRLKKMNKDIEKFVICWTLTIPQELIDSPFFQLANSSISLRKNIENQIQEMLNQILKLDEFIDLKSQTVELIFL